MPPSRPLHVLVTGGSRGIGLSIAQLFAKKGYRCTLIARSEEALKTAVASLQPLPTTPDPSAPSRLIGSNPSQPHLDAPSPLLRQHAYIPGDITLRTEFWTKDAESPFARTLPYHAAHSSIDVLVNCAGVAQKSLFLKTSHDDIDGFIDTNLAAMIHGTRFIMRQYMRGKRRDMAEAPTPSIINISSIFGTHAGFGAAAYAATKAGVLGFTRALATEYASHRVRVNAIAPGYIATDMTSDLDAAELAEKIPLGRVGQPEEIAQAALFLAENEYAHNCVVGLDGGLSAV